MSNHFYIGEVKYRNEILPGEQPPIMDRALFEAIRQKSLAQWSHRTIVRNKSDYLLSKRSGVVSDAFEQVITLGWPCSCAKRK